MLGYPTWPSFRSKCAADHEFSSLAKVRRYAEPSLFIRLRTAFAINITRKHGVWGRKPRARGNPPSTPNIAKLTFGERDRQQVEQPGRRGRHERYAQDCNLAKHLGRHVQHRSLPGRNGLG